MSTIRTAELAADPRLRSGLEAQLEQRRTRLSAGEKALGWKLGFGSPAAMGKLGTAAPLIGFLTDRSLVGLEHEVSVAAYRNPVLEPEVAVRLAADLAPGGGEDAAREAIESVGPAFELVDLDPPPTDVAEILAGNIFHRAVALGPTARAAALDGLSAVVGVGDEIRPVEDPQAATGPVLGLVRHVADLLGEFGESLAAGEVVICGSIVGPLSVAGGDSVAYRLDPIGAISISLTG
jgi:2-keto-4-pentenoate hydratase